ncbi:MAG: TIGR03790 family protein [Spirochaetes bacterium]|nr:TIGR03790 family protein [Spirochaetota bacterium]
MNASQSKGLARFYMERRQIPETNLVLLFMTDSETCSREAYEEKALPPIRRFLETNPQIRAIVTLYGVPLRIAAPEASPEEKAQLKEWEDRKKQIENDLVSDRISDSDTRQRLHDELAQIQKQRRSFLQRIDKVASFDSELSLIKKTDYDLNMWLPNPFYLGFQNQETQITKSEVLMTSRLDGASPEIVKRIITDSIEAEKEGLSGTACFDARWPAPKPDTPVSGYSFYDRSIHRAALSLSISDSLTVVLNDEPALFLQGQCPDTALYCGWYSLARYVDAFAWQKGSVGYHIASSECTTLKQESSQVWCKKMLDLGATATVGPVGEPYVQAFPVPEVFFKFLAEGYLTLAESHLISLPYLSWKMVLVGDPLYRVNLVRNATESGS